MSLESWAMKSNYKKLGPYIREIVEKNSQNQIEKLLGVSIQKCFIPSIANTIGTDMTTYKIVRENQFAYGPVTSRNGDKISVALLQDSDCIISTSYTVFEINRHNELLPEYLMMWFRRPEFDRYARFMSHGSVREIFGWEEMCNVELPIPHIDTQKEIVAEYNTIVNRIKLNEQLNQKLEETAQAIYKQWFVDFDFPDENGNPYKSSGGEMVYSQTLDKEIPCTWRNGTIDELTDLIDGDRGTNYPSQGEMLSEGYCLFLNAGNVTKNGFAFDTNMFITEEKDRKLRKGKLQMHDVVLTTRGTVGNLGYFGKNVEYSNIRINSGMIIMRCKAEPTHSFYVYLLMKSSDMKDLINSYMSGSAQPQFPIRDIVSMPVIIPDKNIISNFVEKILPIQDDMDLTNKQIRHLKRLKDILLSKISKVEVVE